MNNLMLLMLLMLFALTTPHLCIASNLYVSPSGSDENDGSKDKPFKTLIAARDAVRKLNRTMTEDIVVYLRGGEYLVDTTIDFKPIDSGFNGKKVVYRAFENEQPIFTGGFELKTWKLHDKKRNIYSFLVPKGIYRQLYINGERAVRARSPNQLSKENFGPYLEVNLTQKNELFVTAEDWKIVSDVGNINEVEMVVISHWYHQRLLIGKHRPKESGWAISPLYTKDKMTKPRDFYNNSVYFFENSYAFIDQPFEWYHDTRADKIYLALGSDIDPSTLNVVIPRTEVLINIIGSSENQVQNLEFNGLTFEYSTWHGSSKEGVNIDQFAQPIIDKLRGALPAAIRVTHTLKSSFRNNVFRHMGANAIYLHDADYANLEGNEIYQISANGIVIDREKRNPKPGEQSLGVAIWNNHIRQVGQDYTNGGAVLANNVRSLIVEHNLIYDMPYSGIQICNQPGGLRYIGCSDNRVCYNHIHHTMQLHDDGGGIYTLGGVQNGTVIAENFLHDISSGDWAGSYPVSMIYLDNSTSKILVRDNVVRGGKAEQRNGSIGNDFVRNLQSNPSVEGKAGINKGYNPRHGICK